MRAIAIRLSLCTLLLAAASHDALGAAEGNRIGVLYLEEVFQSSVLVENRSVKLRERVQDANAAVKAKEEELKKLQDRIKLTSEESPERPRLIEDYKVLELRVKLFRERQSRTLQTYEADLLRQSYRELKTLIRDFSEERDFSLIFLMPDPEIKSEQTQPVRMEIAQHTVLYHDPDMDITDDFIEFANQRSEDGGGESADARPGFDEGAPRAGGD